MIYFWDMDHTIVENDCDVSWKEFLVAKGIAPQEDLQQVNFFYQQYLNKSLNIDKFIKFQLRDFCQYSHQQMQQLCQQHFEEVVKGKIFIKAQKMIQQQLRDNKIVCLITATNNYIAQPLADFLGINYVKATKLEETATSFTGNYLKPYCYGLGKINYMSELIVELALPSNTPTAYYGDSVNDKVIFQKVTKAFVINAQGQLLKDAQENNWQVVNFKITS